MRGARRGGGVRVHQQGGANDHQNDHAEQQHIGLAHLVAQRQGEHTDAAKDHRQVHQGNPPLPTQAEEDAPEAAHQQQDQAGQHAHTALAALPNQG